ncbi:MarR family winged helix-turn-helix transcriptional regulator [Streptomyces sp. NPDC004082]|uniref:MarR family winged helix-turn-helix transcriptional regulator n=1 Tax=unclassified Streptomyces TaxID=2593676 RepID=UPI0033BCD680
MEGTRDLAETCNNLALRRAARYLGAAYDKALAPLGLRSTQLSVLRELTRVPTMTITGLAERIAMDRTTLAAALKPLVREGLVTVEPSPADRRVRVVSVTPEGRSRVEAGRALLETTDSRFEAAYGAGDAARLRASLGRVLASGFHPWAE